MAGYTIVPNELIDGDLDPFCFRIWVLLRRYTQPAFPSINTIAKKTSISRSTVLRSLKKLEKLGLIQIEKVHRTSTRYYVLEPVDKSVDKPVDNFSASVCETPTSVCETLALVSVRHPNNTKINKTKLISAFDPQKEWRIIWQAVRRIGRERSSEARKQIGEWRWGVVDNKLGGWYQTCNMNDDQWTALKGVKAVKEYCTEYGPPNDGEE